MSFKASHRSSRAVVGDVHFHFLAYIPLVVENVYLRRVGDVVGDELDGYLVVFVHAHIAEPSRRGRGLAAIAEAQLGQGLQGQRAAVPHQYVGVHSVVGVQHGNPVSRVLIVQPPVVGHSSMSFQVQYILRLKGDGHLVPLELPCMASCTE